MNLKKIITIILSIVLVPLIALFITNQIYRSNPQLSMPFLWLILAAIVIALGTLAYFLIKRAGTPVSQPEQTPVVETPEPTEKLKGAGETENIPDQIEKLAKLKEQGILSDAEFEEKKKELLARM